MDFLTFPSLLLQIKASCATGLLDRMPNDYQPPEKGKILKNKNVKKRKKKTKGG